MTHPIWTRLLWIHYLIGIPLFIFDLYKYLSMLPNVNNGIFTDSDGFVKIMIIVLITTIIGLTRHVILFVVCFLRKKSALILVPLLEIIFYIINYMAGLPLLKANNIPEAGYITASIFMLILPLMAVSIVYSNKEEYDN